MSINRRKFRNNGNETLLFVGTRDAPSPHEAYLGSDKVGHPGEDGKCFRKCSVCSDIDSTMNFMMTTLTTTTRLLFSPLAFANGSVRRTRRWSKVGKGQ